MPSGEENPLEGSEFKLEKSLEEQVRRKARA
jgi:hypothetical protein